jgi:ribosomal protein L11 methyltransferase
MHTGDSRLLRVSVTVPPAEAERARAIMLELFPHGFEESDGVDGVELAAYTDPAGEERLWAAFGGARSDEVEEGWAERWRAFHRPTRVGPLWVGPPWEDPDSDAVAVVIDPGRAFGTGGHATTRLCLELLLDLPRDSMLDVGCGSGVLAIAAVKLGFAPVNAVDVDEQAIEATLRNAQANEVSLTARRVNALTDDLPPAGTAVVNISVELDLAVGARLGCDRLITSGYLVSESPEVSGYRREGRRDAEGWAADLHVRTQ